MEWILWNFLIENTHNILNQQSHRKPWDFLRRPSFFFFFPHTTHTHTLFDIILFCLKKKNSDVIPCFLIVVFQRKLHLLVIDWCALLCYVVVVFLVVKWPFFSYVSDHYFFKALLLLLSFWVNYYNYY